MLLALRLTPGSSFEAQQPLARGVMHQCDWPVHAAAALGMPGHFDLFPPDYAHRLHGRERSRSGYGPDLPTAIPHAIGDERPYTWPSPPAPALPPARPG